MRRRFLEQLKNFPEDFASTDKNDLAIYGRDWTQRYTASPSMLVRPRSTVEVSRFLALCHTYRIPVVPSGGRTGMAGGAVAAQSEVVLSLERMNAMQPIDMIGQTVRVEAGTITQAVHTYCAHAGLFWPVDFASKGSSQIGGNIATNAGGMRVIRYGLTRQWVLGLTVVTAQGDVLELNGALEKNNNGIDLRQLFIGSEGILGIITEATLKLTRLPSKTDVFLFALDSLESVLTLFEDARRGPFTITAYEFFTSACSAHLERHSGMRPPFETKASHYVLLEVEAHQDIALNAWLQKLFEDQRVKDGILAGNLSQARNLWELREGITAALDATAMVHKNDVSLPVAALRAFCRELETFLEQCCSDLELCLFGHIGDGNLHVNVMKPELLSKDEFLSRTRDLDEKLMRLVHTHCGSMSAEHGIGLLKRNWLAYSRSAIEIQLMQSLKKVFDPLGILNPGKVFQTGSPSR